MAENQHTVSALVCKQSSFVRQDLHDKYCESLRAAEIGNALQFILGVISGAGLPIDNEISQEEGMRAIAFLSSELDRYAGNLDHDLRNLTTKTVDEVEQ